MSEKTGDAQETVEEFKFDDLPPIKGFPELRWAGKRPFRSTHFFPAQKKESYGEPVDGWMNRIYWGDNLQVMSHLLKEFRGKVDLVYLDPPFDSKAKYNKTIKVRGKKYQNDMNSFEEKQYSDIWNDDNFLQFIFERLILTKQLMSDNAQVFFHCDHHQNYHIRAILDEVFGPSFYKNEIIWFYENKLGTGGDTFDRFHDTIIVYTRSKSWTHNQIRVPVKNVKMQPVTQKIDGERVWLRDEDGNRLYQESEGERSLGDVWSLPIINPVANERTGYPTQKPERLLERIISAASNPGDLVLDTFMGSGTTQSVAMRLGRRFIGADINLGAIETTVKRLNTIREGADQDELKLDGDAKIYSGFEVHNVNNYDIFRNPVQAKDVLKEALELQPLEHHGVFDGVKDGFMVKIMPVNRIATRQDLNELITGVDYKSFERRRSENPNKPVEKIELVCMGHEPDLAATLQEQMKPYEIEVRVVDVLRDKTHLEFKRSAEAKVVIRDGKLIVENFFPMNLLQKLSVEEVEDWRQLVETIKIDWNYDGAVLEPAIIDSPEGNNLVSGEYEVPDDAGTIRIKITDLLSESLEQNVESTD